MSARQLVVVGGRLARDVQPAAVVAARRSAAPAVAARVAALDARRAGEVVGVARRPRRVGRLRQPRGDADALGAHVAGDVALGDDVVFYDFNQPTAIPSELHGAFALVVIDPPFITREVWEKYAEAAHLLLCPRRCPYQR